MLYEVITPRELRRPRVEPVDTDHRPPAEPDAATDPVAAYHQEFTRVV